MARYVIRRAVYKGRYYGTSTIARDARYETYSNELNMTEPPDEIDGPVRELRRSDRCEVIGKDRADMVIDWLMSLARDPKYVPIRFVVKD